MIEKIKDINPSIPGMLIVQLLYLIVGEALIICIAKTPLKPAIGFVAGVAYAVFSTFHMSLRIRKVVYGGANTSVTFILGYGTVGLTTGITSDLSESSKWVLMLVMFTVLYVFDLGDLLFAILGMFSMKVAAYIQPFTDKLINKIKKGR